MILQPIDILIVEDSPEDTEFLVRQLRAAHFEPQWHRVETQIDYLLHLRPNLDLIVADLSLPQFSGMRALELMKSRSYEIPFIMVSGRPGEEWAVEAIKRGATDYLLKDRMERLGSAVSRALEEKQLRQDVVNAEKAVEERERKFRALYDAAHDAIYILRDGIFVDCNAKGQYMYGRTLDQIVGHTPGSICPAPAA